MSRRNRPIFALFAVGLSTASVTLLVSAQAEPPKAEGTYIGSERCRTCHVAEYAVWKRSLHVQMTKPIEQATVQGDFEAGDPVTQHGRTYAMNVTGGRYAIAVTQPGAATETFPVDYSLGAKRLQGHLSRLPDGRLYVLPVFWNTEW